jgi:hypothetical protein
MGGPGTWWEHEDSCDNHIPDDNHIKIPVYRAGELSVDCWFKIGLLCFLISGGLMLLCWF